MKWLAECSADALRDALRAVAPELSRLPFTVPEPVAATQADPLYWTSSAVLGERFVAKFAWSRPAAIRLAHEIGTLDRAGQQLARFLAALQQPAMLERAEAAIGRLSGPVLPPLTTRVLRDRLGRWIRPDQHRSVLRWYDWADEVLASRGPASSCVPLADHRTPPAWVDDLAARFRALGIEGPLS